MKRLALAMLWFYAVGLAAAAFAALPAAPRLAAALAVGSGMCIWAVIARSAGAVAALGLLPLVVGAGAVASQSPNQPPDLWGAIGIATILWGGLCVAISRRIRRIGPAAP